MLAVWLLNESVGYTLLGRVHHAGGFDIEVKASIIVAGGSLVPAVVAQPLCSPDEQRQKTKGKGNRE